MCTEAMLCARDCTTPKAAEEMGTLSIVTLDCDPRVDPAHLSRQRGLVGKALLEDFELVVGWAAGAPRLSKDGPGFLFVPCG
jgi:hypothetical protein